MNTGELFAWEHYSFLRCFFCGVDIVFLETNTNCKKYQIKNWDDYVKRVSLFSISNWKSMLVIHYFKLFSQYSSFFKAVRDCQVESIYIIGFIWCYRIFNMYSWFLLVCLWHVGEKYEKRWIFFLMVLNHSWTG